MNRIMYATLKRNKVRGLFLATYIVSLAMQPFTASPAVATNILPVLWTAGGLSAGTDSAGQAARMTSDAMGNVAIVSGPALARSLAVTSYTASGVLRWQRMVSPSWGTFRGDWVVAAPNGDFAAVGTNVDSHGNPFGITLVRYASDGTLLWRLDLSRWRPSVARLLADSAGNTYLAFSSIGDAQDIQVHKYDASGVLVWSQVVSTGSFANDIATSLALSPDQTDVVVTGDISGGLAWITAAFNATTGARKWLVNAPEGIAALDVVMDDGNVYVTGVGSVGSQGLNSALTVIAYDRATGARLWRTDSRPSDLANAYGQRIALAPDGSLVAVGYASATACIEWWTVAMETSGAVRWQTGRSSVPCLDEMPRAIFVLADGTTVVSGSGGPLVRDILGNSYLQGVTAGYGPNGTLLWEAFSKLPTAWAAALPNGDVCATGGYDALVTCFAVSAGVPFNQPPMAVISAAPLSGTVPLTVSFNGSGSMDPDGTIVSYVWSFGDGTTTAAINPSHTYTSAGTYIATLTVTDNDNLSASRSVIIFVNPDGNTLLRSTAISLSATLQGKKVNVTGNVVVKNANGAAVSGALVSATWAIPGGATVAQSATTSSTGIANFSTSGGRGTYTLTVTNVAKSGYSFDSTSSVLSRSITK